MAEIKALLYERGSEILVDHREAGEIANFRFGVGSAMEIDSIVMTD
jgi:hypothetical protein